MADQVINASSGGSCTLWTPWGPQSTAASSPRLTSIRRALRKLGDKKEQRHNEKAKAAAKPECAYEP